MAASITDKLKVLEKQNRLFTENLVDAIWILDANTLTYEYITPSIHGLSGYTAEELIGTPIADRLSPESQKKVSELFQKELSAYELGSRAARSIEVKMLNKSGQIYWIEVRAKLVRNPDGTLKIVGVSREITSKKIAQQELENLNKKLISALADKEKLLEEIKVLRGLLPICSGCKRIRDDEGKWWPLEAYVRMHTDSDFTHTICTDCMDVIYPEVTK